jgi:hypothetical protein
MRFLIAVREASEESGLSAAALAKRASLAGVVRQRSRPFLFKSQGVEKWGDQSRFES